MHNFNPLIVLQIQLMVYHLVNFDYIHTYTHTHIYIYPSTNSMMWAHDRFDTEEENYCLTIILIHCLRKKWKLMF